MALLIITFPVLAAQREIVFVLKSGNELRTQMYGKMAAAFEKAYPEAKVTFIDGKEEKVRVMIAGGTPPNYWHAGAEDFGNFVHDGALMPIDSILKADKMRLEDHFFVPTVEASKYRGVTYAFPANVNVDVLYFNEDLFATAGVAPPPSSWSDPSWNWDAFRTAARKLTRDINGDGIADVMGFQFNDNQSMIYTQIFGGRWTDAQQTRFTGDSEPIMRAIQLFWDMMHVDRSVAPPNMSGYKFDRGTAAMQWYLSSSMAKYRPLAFDWDIAAIPGGAQPWGYPNTWKFVKGAPNADLAYEFAKFIQLSEDWASDFAEAWGGIPPLRRAVVPYLRKTGHTQRQIDVLMGALERMLPRGVGERRWHDIAKIVQTATGRIWAGEVSPVAGVEEARTGIEAILRSL